MPATSENFSCSLRHFLHRNICPQKFLVFLSLPTLALSSLSLSCSRIWIEMNTCATACSVRVAQISEWCTSFHTSHFRSPRKNVRPPSGHRKIRAQIAAIEYVSLSFAAPCSARPSFSPSIDELISVCDVNENVANLMKFHSLFNYTHTYAGTQCNYHIVIGEHDRNIHGMRSKTCHTD